MDWDDEEEDGRRFIEERDRDHWQRAELKLASGHRRSAAATLASCPERSTGRADYSQTRGKTRSAHDRVNDVGAISEQYYTLFVGNLPTTVYEIHLEEYFRPYGDVCHVFVQRSIKENMDTTYGFVRFGRKHEAEQAMKAMNKAYVNGKHISVSSCRKPHGKAVVDEHLNRKGVRQKEVAVKDLTAEDDNKLWYLIETYTMLLAQNPDGSLPELGEMLRMVNSQENKLVPVHTIYEHEISSDLNALQESFIQSFSADFANDPVNMDLLAKENTEGQARIPPQNMVLSSDSQWAPDWDNPENTVTSPGMAREPAASSFAANCDTANDSGSTDSEACSTSSRHRSRKQLIHQTAAPYAISIGRGKNTAAPRPSD